jgi:hypothetical protein
MATKKNPSRDGGNYVYRKPNVSFDFNIGELPWTRKQQNLIQILQNKKTKCALIKGPAGTSKAQPLYSEILTPTGKTTMGELKVGDFVLDRNGTPTKVLGIFPQGEKKIYRVHFSDNTSTECCDDHLWLTWDYKERNYKTNKLPSVKSLNEIKNSLYSRNGSHLNHKIPICDPLHFEKRDLPIDPYVMGVLLGDGGLKYNPIISSCDPFILNEIETRLEGSKLVYVNGSNCDYRITYPNRFDNPLKNILKNINCNVSSLDKHIPEDYLYSSIEDRISILRGLMDSDGSISLNDKGTSTFEYYSTSSKTLSENVRFLVQSLGGTATISERETYYYDSDGIKIDCNLSYAVNICMNPEINPFLLPRKSNMYIPKTKYPPRRYITNVEEIGNEDCQCILVDNAEHLYLTNDCIVTHNTILAIYAGLQLLREKKISDITYVRSAVESGSSKLGFLPGDINDKFSVYATPLQDKLEELLPPQVIKMLNEGQHVKAMPINYMRGLSFSGRLIILDESQNFTTDELVTAVTRLGEHSRIWVLGDPNQSDLTGKSKNDFVQFCNKLNDEECRDNGIESFDFDVDDIVRSEFCKFVVKKLEVYEHAVDYFKSPSSEWSPSS